MPEALTEAAPAFSSCFPSFAMFALKFSFFFDLVGSKHAAKYWNTFVS
jgi:hypothetical protein